jgi:hypothetical protein
MTIPAATSPSPVGGGVELTSLGGVFGSQGFDQLTLADYLSQVSRDDLAGAVDAGLCGRDMKRTIGPPDCVTGRLLHP